MLNNNSLIFWAQHSHLPVHIIIIILIFMRTNQPTLVLILENSKFLTENKQTNLQVQFS